MNLPGPGGDAARSWGRCCPVPCLQLSKSLPPSLQVDLAVHKKKIGEVQQWLEFALSPVSVFVAMAFIDLSLASTVEPR